LEKLGLNWGLLVAQLFNFIILIWLLTRFLYQPVLNMLNERTRRIQDSLKETEQVKEQLARANQDYDAKLAQARQEADRIRSDAREQAVQERDGLMRDLKNQMADLVTATASRVLGAELKSNHDQLIEESLASLGRQN
jgi:F-type H+-transporting ATPase subunit b